MAKKKCKTALRKTSQAVSVENRAESGVPGVSYGFYPPIIPPLFRLPFANSTTPPDLIVLHLSDSILGPTKYPIALRSHISANTRN